MTFKCMSYVFMVKKMEFWALRFEIMPPGNQLSNEEAHHLYYGFLFQRKC